MSHRNRSPLRLALVALLAASTAVAEGLSAQAPDTGIRPVALVTGSTDGLGRELALRLGLSGHHVIVHGRNAERGRAVVEEIEARDGSASLLIADLASMAQGRELAATVLRDNERLDVLVNNAGIGRGADGATVEVQAMDWSTLTSRRAMKDAPGAGSGGWNIFHTYSTAADVASPVSNIGISGGGVERAWFGWPTDEAVEKMRDEFSLEPDPAKQKEIAVALQKRLYEVVPYINYGQWVQPVAYRSNLDGVLISPVPFFWNISKN
jgi:hypothetical protein